MAKIMLVEDDNNLREIYEARLQAEGYTLVSAKDGEEALVMAKNEQPDLIISDVMMPKVSGFEMLDILRNTEGLKEVKVIMLTALGQSDDQQRADRLGANRYLVKSQVTLEDIVKVTHELLGDSPGLVAVEPVVEAAIPVATDVVPVAAPVTPMPEPSPVMTMPPVEDNSTAITSAQEEADMSAQIETFVASNPAPAEAPVASTEDNIDANDTQVMSDAIDSLMANTQTINNPLSAEPVATEQPAPEAVMPSVPEPTPTETLPEAEIGSVPIAHKKLISPLDTAPVAARPDINALLAIEEAKEAAAAQSQAQAPSLDVTSHSPASEVVKPFDPNNIAL